MSESALAASFEYLCYGSTAIIDIVILSDPLYTSESDVYRRYILTYKNGPRTERIKTIIMAVDP